MIGEASTVSASPYLPAGIAAALVRSHSVNRKRAREGVRLDGDFGRNLKECLAEGAPLIPRKPDLLAFALNDLYVLFNRGGRHGRSNSFRCRK